MKLEKIACSFVGDFKVGDNIVASSASLCRLCSTNEDQVFNKLIVIQAGSIIEASLDQVVYRSQNFTKEGVPNISEADLAKIRGTKIERFNNIIQAARKYDLLSGVSETVYEDLNCLRELRNRVHIQFDDAPDNTSRDDGQAFDDKTVKWALTLCISILKHLEQHYPRPKALQVYVSEIEIPVL